MQDNLVILGYELINELGQFWTGLSWEKHSDLAARYANLDIAKAVAQCFPEVDGDIEVVHVYFELQRTIKPDA